MEWEIVGVIVVLIGLLGAIISPILKLNTSITKLTVVVDRLAKDTCSLTDDNKKAHDKLWGKNDEQDETLNRHETEIIVLKERTGTK